MNKILDIFSSQALKGNQTTFVNGYSRRVVYQWDLCEKLCEINKLNRLILLELMNQIYRIFRISIQNMRMFHSHCDLHHL